MWSEASVGRITFELKKDTKDKDWDRLLKTEKKPWNMHVWFSMKEQIAEEQKLLAKERKEREDKEKKEREEKEKEKEKAVDEKEKEPAKEEVKAEEKKEEEAKKGNRFAVISKFLYRRISFFINSSCFCTVT